MKVVGLCATAAAMVFAAASDARAEAREVYECRYAEGKGYEDLVAAYEIYRGLMDKNGFTDYHVELLFPLYNTATDTVTVIWQGTTPSMARLGEANDWYWFADDAAPARAAFEAAVVCSSASMFYIEKLD